MHPVFSWLGTSIDFCRCVLFRNEYASWFIHTPIEGRLGSFLLGMVNMLESPMNVGLQVCVDMNFSSGG